MACAQLAHRQLNNQVLPFDPVDIIIMVITLGHTKVILHKCTHTPCDCKHQIFKARMGSKNWIKIIFLLFLLFVL